MGICSGAQTPLLGAPEYRDAYPNILLCPQSEVSGINPERVASGFRRIQVGIVSRRRWAAVLMFKEGLLEKARWVTRTPSPNQCEDRETPVG